MAQATTELNLWFEYLRSKNILHPLDPPEDPFRIIAPVTELWQKQEIFPAAYCADEDMGRQVVSGPTLRPQAPADFLDALRESRERARAEQIQAGLFTLPAALSEVANRIIDSHSILLLPNNWDGEGSPSYRESTWLRAADLVARSSASFWTTLRAVPSPPIISHGPDGSIDIVWKAGKKKLAVNIPEEPSDVVTFFGRDVDSGHNVLQGEAKHSEDFQWMLVWLTT